MPSTSVGVSGTLLSSTSLQSGDDLSELIECPSESWCKLGRKASVGSTSISSVQNFKY
jgi:hypothetical protein